MIHLSSQERDYSSNRPLGARAPPRPTSGLRAPSRPTPRLRAPSHPTETHTAADHFRSKRMGLGQSSDTREEIGTPQCNPRFSFAYKRGGGDLHKENHEIKTQEHDTNTRPSSDRALNTRSLFPLETWDHFPLSSACTPYYKLSVLVTRATTTNWT